MLYKFMGEVAEVAEEATGAASNSTQINWSEVWSAIIQWCLTTGIKIVLAIIIMIVSFKIINVCTKRINKKLEKRNADPTLARALVNVTRLSLKIVVILCLVGFLGIQTSSIAAVLASAGVGLA